MLENKRIKVLPSGIHSPPELNTGLFDFQAAVTRWALKRGKAALFLDTGLGKSRCSIEWARVVASHTGKPVLILTPLAVAAQFVAEGAAIGVDVKHLRSRDDDVSPGVNVLNYEKLDHFPDVEFGGVVLDESSILKDFNGKTRNALIERFSGTRFKLCATATPAPNDHTELGNHAEFLGVMSRTEMLSMFFVHDEDTTQDWRLKGHAVADFWSWVASWAAAIRSPADIGFNADRYALPQLSIEQVTVANSDSIGRKSGQLIGYEASTLTEQREARRDSLAARVSACADMVNSSAEPWLVWCDLNDESAALAAAIPDAVDVRGSDSPEHKEAAVWGFIRGEHRVLVTKPSICGMGLNMQRCAHVAFVGLGYSWELYYQAIRRVYRFGQTREVTVKVITGSAEGRVVDAIRRKQADADAMAVGMVEAMSESMNREIRGSVSTRDEYNANEEMMVPSWLK
jgi:hypothetical protein